MKTITENTVVENNRLIAEFMGLVNNDKNYSSGRSIEYKKGAFVDYEGMGAGWLHYNTDWNYLMPVVVKCFDVNDDINDDLHFKLNDALLETNIDSLYKVVIEFIKWYNTEYTDKEDFINHLLNQTDYESEEIIEYADEHFENLISIEENENNFIKWYNENNNI